MMKRVVLCMFMLGVAFGSAANAQAAASWKGAWIAAPWSTPKDGAMEDGSAPLPVFQRVFALRVRPMKAELRIAGLGQWQATIASGGHESMVGEPGLHQAWTDYRRTVTYERIDVTRLLARGQSTLTVMLGNGMYNVQRTVIVGARHDQRYTKFAGSFGEPKMTAVLDVTYAGGGREEIVSDARWKVKRGPVVFDSAYGGEDFDATRDRDADWNAAKVVEAPGGEMIEGIAPIVGQHEVYAPVKTTDVGGGRVVYDLGQNFAGIVRLRVKGGRGAVVRMTPGELLNADGTVNQATFHGPVWWSYRLRGDANGETWEPLFGYGGFRYVQVEWTAGPGMPAATAAAGHVLELRGVAVHSDAKETGTFSSSSEMLNAIHRLIVHAMHNNEVSLLTDCPHREKLGWLEQTHLVAPGLIFNNDVQSLLAATDRNMHDAQWADGIVPTIAPAYTRFGPKNAVFDDSPEWGSASVLEPWWAYRFYGDRTQLERDYAMMRGYVKALAGKARDGIVAYGLGDWYDIGPGSPGIEKNTSLGVTATMMLVEDAAAMEKIATLLGRTQDAAEYRALHQSTAAAFNRKFWDASHDWYDRGSQTANAMPLALGVVPEDRRAQVLAHVIEDIHAHNDHVTAGEIGYPYLLRALAAAGRDDVILTMLLRRDPPSYGSQLAAGATALTEAWDANPHSSQDHFMLGSADEWFYMRLGGMDLDMSRAASERVTLRPVALKGVDWVRCGYAAKVGKIESDWRREAGSVTYSIAVPVEATVVLPRGARSVGRSAHGESDEGSVRFRVGPGRWVFRVKE